MGISEGTFEKFLAHLSDSRIEAAERYELFRTKLIKYFEWKRLSNVEELADETIDRFARRISKGEIIYDTSKYLIGVARLVAHEEIRRRHLYSVKSLEYEKSLAASLVDPAPSNNQEKFLIDKKLEILRAVLSKLPQNERNLLLEYYSADEQKTDKRQQLANAHNMSRNALAIKMHRIRKRVVEMIKKTLEEDEQIP